MIKALIIPILVFGIFIASIYGLINELYGNTLGKDIVYCSEHVEINTKNVHKILGKHPSYDQIDMFIKAEEFDCLKDKAWGNK